VKKTAFTCIALFFSVLLVSACPATMGSGGSSAMSPNYRPVFDTTGGIDNNKLLDDEIQCTALARQSVSSGGGVNPATGTLIGAGTGATAGAIAGDGRGAAIGAVVGGLLGYGVTAQNQNQGTNMAKLNMAYYNCLRGRGWNPINTP